MQCTSVISIHYCRLTRQFPQSQPWDVPPETWEPYLPCVIPTAAHAEASFSPFLGFLWKAYANILAPFPLASTSIQASKSSSLPVVSLAHLLVCIRSSPTPSLPSRTMPNSKSVMAWPALLAGRATPPGGCWPGLAGAKPQHSRSGLGQGQAGHATGGGQSWARLEPPPLPRARCTCHSLPPSTALAAVGTTHGEMWFLGFRWHISMLWLLTIAWTTCTPLSP